MEYKIKRLARIIGKGRSSKRSLSIAADILELYNDFQKIFNTSPNKLLEIKNVTPQDVAELLFHKNISFEKDKKRISNIPLSVHSIELHVYCQKKLGYEDIEIAKIFFLNKDDFLIQEECHQIGTMDEVSVYIREIFKRAFDLEASGLILVHNHPSGNTTPSDSDLTICKKIGDVCSLIDFNFKGGIVVGKYSVTIIDKK